MNHNYQSQALLMHMQFPNHILKTKLFLLLMLIHTHQNINKGLNKKYVYEVIDDDYLKGIYIHQKLWKKN